MPYNPEFHSSILFLEKTAHMDEDVINKDVLAMILTATSIVVAKKS